MLFISTASSRKWGPEEILNSKNYEADKKEIEKAKVNGVIFLPPLMGERSPHNDVTAKGAFIGLSVTTSGERSKAAMERSGFCAERLSESRARGQSGTEKYETLRRGKEQSMGANPVGDAVASRTKFGNGARPRVREKDIGDGGLRGIRNAGRGGG